MGKQECPLTLKALQTEKQAVDAAPRVGFDGRWPGREQLAAVPPSDHEGAA